MKALRILFIAVIVAACLVPSVFMVAGYKNPNRENRVLAKLPSFIEKGSVNTEFFTKLDKYTNDHFAFRDVLVNAFNSLDVAVLNDFNGKNAVIGKNNHIFYGETVDDYLGIDQLSEAEIDSIVNYLAALQTELGEKGIRFAFMVAPNKATIYPEYMPDYLRATDSARNIDMLRVALEKRGVGMIDAAEVLLNAKGTRTVYYEHDSHWNNFGAMLVYDRIAKFFGLEQFDAYDYTTVFDRTGDLHNFVYPVTEYKEERIVYPEFNPWKSKKPIDFDRDKTIQTTSSANGLTMVVYHDSFGRSLQPILSQSVGKLFMSSYFPYKTDYIYKNDPDIVLIELVERNLDKLAEYAISLGY
ncbi:MAG: hypothetical protein K6F68_06415 [Clostridiales bacterium]|nr:hypothetical protein [Clostridiales bacterium]